MDKLKDKLNSLSAHDKLGINKGYVNPNLIKGDFQADHIIGNRYKYGHTDAIFSSDSDFSALTRPTCFCIRSIKKNENSRTNKSQTTGEETHPNSFLCEIVGSCNDYMEELKIEIDEIHPPNIVSWK